MLHLVLCTWEAENSCCWWTSDENSNLLLITDHIRTSRTCPSAPALHSLVKHRPVGCCWGHRLHQSGSAALCSPYPRCCTAGGQGSPCLQGRSTMAEGGCKTSGRAAATPSMCDSLVTRLDTQGQWWQLPSQGGRLAFSLSCPCLEGK